MKPVILMIGLLLCLVVTAAHAAGELLSPRPQCAVVRNATDYSLFGVVRTAYGTASDGKQSRHESTFRLKAGEKLDVCASGPFFPGYQVELIVKTMIPVFSCKTRLKGLIEIKSERTKDDKNRIYATCIP